MIFQFLNLHQSWLAAPRVHSERSVRPEILPIMDRWKKKASAD